MANGGTDGGLELQGRPEGAGRHPRFSFTQAQPIENVRRLRRALLFPCRILYKTTPLIIEVRDVQEEEASRRNPRRFSEAEKARLVQEYDSFSSRAEKQAFREQHGLSTVQFSRWRQVPTSKSVLSLVPRLSEI